MTRLTTSDRGLAMIKRFEGFQAEALALPDGQWLTGHGHLLLNEPEGPVTADAAHADLTLDLVAYEELIHSRVATPLTQTQFDALVSFAFSIGLAAFERSDVLRRLNDGDVIAAGAAMDAWRKTRLFGEAQVLDALVRRRAQERAWLLDSEEGLAAPSVLVQAQIDHAAAILGAPTKALVMTDLEQAVAAAVAPPPPQVLETVADPVAMRIASILAAEPDTAIVLARRSVPDFVVRQEAPEPAAEDHEGVAATDEPVELTSVEAQDQTVAAGPVAAVAKPKGYWFGAAMDGVALIGLLVMGLGLLALAGLALSYSAESGGGPLTAAILGGPGALAVAMAAFYLVKGTGGEEA